MNLSFLLLFLTIISCSEKQNEYEKYSALERKAMLEFKDKEYGKALSNFQKAIDLRPTEDVSIYFYATASALNVGNINKAKDLLIASIHNTNTSKNYFLNFEEFDSFRNEKMFSEIENGYDKHIAKFYQNLAYPKIYKEIDSLVKVDQKYRKSPIDWEITNKHDSLNINRLIDITKKYGWQKRAYLILWHQRGSYGEDNYVWNFFKPYIDKQIQKGNMEKSFWTMFDDEKSITENKEQIYGHYWRQFDEYPIKDITNVDKRRIENGLPPLWYMEKVYGIELPTEYKKQ